MGVGVDPVGVVEEAALEEEVDLVEDVVLVAAGVEEEVLLEAEEDLEVVAVVDLEAGVEAKILYNVKLHSAYYTINTFKYTMNTCLYYSNNLLQTFSCTLPSLNSLHQIIVWVNVNNGQQANDKA